MYKGTKKFDNLVSLIYSLDGLTDSNMRPLENTYFFFVLQCFVFSNSQQNWYDTFLQIGLGIQERDNHSILYRIEFD